LADVNVAPLLNKGPTGDAARAAAKDVMSAAIELFQLASGEALTAEVTSKLAAYVPAPLADVLERALGLNEREPFPSLAHFARVLDELPPELRASEQDVSEELERRLGPVLARRKRSLALLVGGSGPQELDDVTRVFRAVSPPQPTRPDTVRPHAGAADEPAVPQPPASAASNWQDMPTRVDRRAAVAAADASAVRPASAPGVEAPTPPATSKLTLGRSSPSSSASPARLRDGLSRSFWLVALALLAALSIAWWATSADTRPPNAREPTIR
jgi:hypothetical protein